MTVFSLSCALLALAAEPAAAGKIAIKMGTVAPQGTVWHKAMLEMAEVFSQETGGQIELKVYAGVVGDETTIVRKLRIGQLHAATLTNSGLALITTEPMAVQLPMLFDNYQEQDAVFAQMQPLFDQALLDDGYVTLTWSDGGWFYFFTKRPATAVSDVKGMKMWMWANDPKALQAFAEIGFSPVVLSSVDVIPSLQTGLIEVFPTTPISAVALQSYRQTPHMIDVRWGSLIGGTVITKQAWDRIPEPARARIRARCFEVGNRLTEAVRREEANALAAMKSKGLVVHTPSGEQMAEWHAMAKRSLAIVRGGSVDAALADRALQLRDAYRAQRARKP
ncbi:MAG: TRAP transporter substrate-binding protein DctP [Deltaproteobacteria bacterium]|nr:TRAP transporter substrate-binding protein DctP [Deltaproteobacteria bacterium]